MTFNRFSVKLKALILKLYLDFAHWIVHQNHLNHSSSICGQLSLSRKAWSQSSCYNLPKIWINFTDGSKDHIGLSFHEQYRLLHALKMLSSFKDKFSEERMHNVSKYNKYLGDKETYWVKTIAEIVLVIFGLLVKKMIKQ